MPRGEPEIRQDAGMWALVAELEALKTDRAGMEAHGGYSEESFYEVSKAMTKIAERLRKEI